MKHFRRTFVTRRKPKWKWHRHTTSVTVAHPMVNLDILQSYKTTAGITINLPDLTIWRIKLRISIVITAAAALAAADGVLTTLFVDSVNQTPVNLLTLSDDQAVTIYEMDYLSHVPAEGGGNGAGTYYIERNFDLKSHRKLRSTNDTMFLQLCEAGQAVFSSINCSYSILFREA